MKRTANLCRIVVLTLVVAISALSSVSWAEWKTVSTQPKNPPYTYEKEVNERGETRETTTTRSDDGRITDEVQVVKDKDGNPISIVNRWWHDPDHPWLQTGGFMQEFKPRHDYRWDPKTDSWYEVPVGSAWKSETNSVQFKMAAGTITCALPIMEAGDTISGTVNIAPAGTTDAEREKNAGVLEGCVVDVGGQKSGANQKWAKWIIPSAKLATFVLLDSEGKTIGKQTIQVSPISNLSFPKFILPRLGQSGRPITIPGPFDGDMANTSVSVGGQQVQVLAESPRGVTIATPRSAVGVTTIEIHEGPKSASGTFRGLGINLSAPKTALLRGEKTELTVQVNGLEGIKEPMAVQVSNRSPETITLGGGNEQCMLIDPSQVGAGGFFAATMPITAERQGGFSINAKLCQGMPNQFGETRDKYGKVNNEIVPPTPGRTPIWEAAEEAIAAQARADAARAKDPNSKDAGEAAKAADEADVRAAASMMGMTAAQRANLYREIAKFHKDRAAALRKLSDNKKSEARKTRERANRPENSGAEERNMREEADAADREAERAEAEATSTDAKSRAAEERAALQHGS